MTGLSNLSSIFSGSKTVATSGSSASGGTRSTVGGVASVGGTGSTPVKKPTGSYVDPNHPWGATSSAGEPKDSDPPASGGTGSGSTADTGKKKNTSGFPDDGARQMPTTQASLDNIRRIQQRLVARSGRTSTRLADGMRSFTSFLG
jgi:hypothetical protein